MAEASGSDECRPSTSKVQPTPDSPADGESPTMCTCSPEGASGCNSCPQRPQSPPPSATLPISKFFRDSPHAQPEPEPKGKGAGKKSKAASTKQKSGASKASNRLKLHKLPRYLWAAFGRVSGPLKRHLRRRNSGQRAKREFPWSKARCVACLFNVQWFEAMAKDDEVGKMMRAIASPRPNRALKRSRLALQQQQEQPEAHDNGDDSRNQPGPSRSRRELFPRGITSPRPNRALKRSRLAQQQPETHDNCDDSRNQPGPSQSQPGPSRSRRELFPDIPEERPRPLSDIFEEEEEEREFMEAQREFADHYSARLPPNGEFEAVAGQDNEEDDEDTVQVGVKRKADAMAENENNEKALVVFGENSGADNKDNEVEPVTVARKPVRRRLF